MGAAPLGYFDKANQLLHMPVHQFSYPVGSVAIPALASLQQSPDRFRNYFRYAVFFMGLITFPFVFTLVIFANEVVLVILGAQWTEVTPIFRILAAASIVGIFRIALRWIYVSLGKANKQFHWGMVDCFFNFLFLGIGIQYGVLGVATAFSCKALVLIYPELVYCFKDTFMKKSDLLAPLKFSLIYSGVTFFAIWSLKGYAELQLNPLLMCIIGGLAYLLMYVLLYLALPSSRKVLLTNLEKLRQNV